MSAASCEIQVRYSELTANGFVHHANYINWYDQLQYEFIAKNGHNLRELTKSGINFMPYEMYSKYIRPISIDDQVRVEMDVLAVTNIKVEIEYTLFANDKKAASCKTIYACLDEKQRPFVLPRVCPEIYQLLKDAIN